MNIPIEVAQAQGVHGIKGAAHGIKGGRPRLDLTDEQRAERRRGQQEACRRRPGRPSKVRPIHWALEYCDIWARHPVSR